MMDKQILIKNLAKVIEGLEVPYSLDRRLLGTAGEAWNTIYRDLNCFGYASAEEIETKLSEALK